MKPHEKQKTGHAFKLHCDECHHEVHFTGRITRAIIGFQCPVCRTEMLDEAGYNGARRVESFVAFLRFLRIIKPADRPVDPASDVAVQVRQVAGRSVLEDAA